MASLAPILLSDDSVMLALGIVFLYVGAELLVGSASALALGRGVKTATADQSASRITEPQDLPSPWSDRGICSSNG